MVRNKNSALENSIWGKGDKGRVKVAWNTNQEKETVGCNEFVHSLACGRFTGGYTHHREKPLTLKMHSHLISTHRYRHKIRAKEKRLSKG